MAHVLIVFKFALIKIMVSGTRESMMHQKRRSMGLGSSPDLRPWVEVVAMVNAAPSSVVARNSKVDTQKMIIKISLKGKVCRT